MGRRHRRRRVPPSDDDESEDEESISADEYGDKVVVCRAEVGKSVEGI